MERLGHVTVMASYPHSSLPHTRCQLQARKRQGVLRNPDPAPHVYVTSDIEKSTVDRKQEKHTGKAFLLLGSLPWNRALFQGN